MSHQAPSESAGPARGEAAARSEHLHPDRRLLAHLLLASGAAFKTVRVEATVYPWSTGAYDVLDVWVANMDGSAPVWRFAGSVVPPGAGLRVLTVDVVLTNAPRQAIRGVFRWNGSRIPCPGGYMDDVDDLAFDVQP